jgi:hypothetical protein
MENIIAFFRSLLIIKTDKNISSDKIHNIIEHNKKWEKIIKNNCYA